MSLARAQPERDQDGHRLLSITDVAKRCGVSTRTIYRWLSCDGLPVHRIPGGGARPILRIAASDLDQWLGQYRKNLAEEEKTIDDRVIRLNGRKFITAGTSSLRAKNPLDRSRRPASRAHPDRQEVGR